MQWVVIGLDSVAFVILLIDVSMRIHASRVGLSPSLDGSKVMDHMTMFDVANVFLLLVSIVLSSVAYYYSDKEYNPTESECKFFEIIFRVSQEKTRNLDQKSYCL